MTEISAQRSAVRNRRADIMSGDAECVTRFLRALFAMVVKPISDFRLLISDLCVLLFALCVAEAQQSNRFNGLDTRRQVEIPTPPGLSSRHFVKDCGIAVILKKKTGATRRKIPAIGLLTCHSVLIRTRLNNNVS